MRKTKEQILRDCTNEHDRKLLIKEFDRWEKTHNKSTLLVGIAVFFTIIGFLGMLFFGNAFLILCFIPVPPLLIWAQINILKGSGLIWHKK